MITAPDLAAAIVACRAAWPMSTYSDFCYVRTEGGPAAPADMSQCSSAMGTWLAATTCCNYMGTLSCGGSCPAGETACSTGCADLMADEANCGTCGHACSAGQTCEGGTCVSRMFRCGWALPGYGCNNGRASTVITATDMAAAIVACHAAWPMSTYSDFCYVRNEGGMTYSGDDSQCTSASGTWRSASSCCNYMGTLSCPS